MKSHRVWHFTKYEEIPEGIQLAVIFYDNDDIWFARRYQGRVIETDARGRFRRDRDRPMGFVRAWMKIRRPPIPRVATELTSARGMFFSILHKQEIERLVKIKEGLKEVVSGSKSESKS